MTSHTISALGLILAGIATILLGCRAKTFYAGKGSFAVSNKPMSAVRGRILFVAVGIFLIVGGIDVLLR
jgi:hypothetical protein